MPVDPLMTVLSPGAWLWDKYGQNLVDKAAGGEKGYVEEFVFASGTGD
jgi:hypothetical protein